MLSLLEAGAEVNSLVRSSQATPLHMAALAGASEVVTALISRGAGLDLRAGPSLYRATPLYLAAQRGHTQLARELIRLGAEVNYVMPRGRHGGHLISLAGEDSVGGHYPVKNTEVGNGATALHAAVENGHLETARALLVGGARQLDSMEGATPLVIALQYKHPHIALLLLEDGWPDPRLDSRVPTDGSSAMFVASGSGYLEVVRRLIERGAAVNLSNKRGATPLSFALSSRHHQVVETLLEAGATTGPEMTSLHSAVQSRSLSLVRRMIGLDSVSWSFLWSGGC